MKHPSPILPSLSKGRSAFTLIELLVVIAIIAILAAILFPVFGQARERARMTTCLSNTKQIGLGIMQYTQDYDDILPVVGVSAQGRGSWMVQIYPYLKSTQIFNCPSFGDAGFVPIRGAAGSLNTSYGWNWNLNSVPPLGISGYALSALQNPSETVIVGDNGITDGTTLQPAFAMFSIDPRGITSGQNLGGGGGYWVKFRHQPARSIPVTYTGGTTTLPIDGRATFSFLDGHSKALNPGQAFERPPGDVEEGHNLTGPPGTGANENVWFKLWNRW